MVRRPRLHRYLLWLVFLAMAFVILMARPLSKPQLQSPTTTLESSVEIATSLDLRRRRTDTPTLWDCMPQSCACRLNCPPHPEPKPKIEIIMYTRSWFITYSKDLYSQYIPGVLDCPQTRCQVSYGPTFQPTTDVLLMVHDEFPARRAKVKKRPDQVFAMINIEPILIPAARYVKGGVDVLFTHQTVANFSNTLKLSYAIGSESRLRAPIVGFKQRDRRIPFWISNRDRVGYNRLGLVEQLGRTGLPLLSLSPINYTALMNFSLDYPQCITHSLRPVIHEYNRRTYEKECALRFSRVTLALESWRLPDYVSEKMMEPLRAGSVPVYLGAPNVKSLLPHPSAAILLDDFESVEKAAEYISRVLDNETLWLSHQAWRNMPFSKGFDHLMRDQCDSIFCRLCDWVKQTRERG